MIKLTREVTTIADDRCGHSWLLKVTASYVSPDEYRKSQGGQPAQSGGLHGLEDYEDSERAASMARFKALRAASKGILDIGTGTGTESLQAGAQEPVDTGSGSGSSSEEEEDCKIFVYHVGEEGDPYRGDLFFNVASVQDMDVIPADEPSGVMEDANGMENFVPFYRTDRVELRFHTKELAARAWEIIKRDTRALMHEYYKGRNLDVAEEIVF